MDALLPFALILVAFYFLIIRPQRARAKAAEQLQGRLAPGVEIMTTSGIFGRVAEIRDDSVVLEVSPGSTLRITKAAVGRVLVEDTTPVDELDETPETTDAADDADGTAGTDVDAARRSPSAE